jgi:hypothetical protein
VEQERRWGQPVAETGLSGRRYPRDEAAHRPCHSASTSSHNTPRADAAAFSTVSSQVSPLFAAQVADLRRVQINADTRNMRSRLPPHRPVLGLLLAVGLVFAAVGSASGEIAFRPKLALTSTGNAAARAAVIHHPDFAAESDGAATWTGGFRKAQLSGGVGCAAYDPKSSDLVLIGAARSLFQHTGIAVESESQVYSTADMVRLDWERAIQSPNYLVCQRQSVERLKHTVVSVARLPYRIDAQYKSLVRVILRTPGKPDTIWDRLQLAKGRTEIGLDLYASRASLEGMDAVEMYFGHLLYARIRP